MVITIIFQPVTLWEANTFYEPKNSPVIQQNGRDLEISLNLLQTLKLASVVQTIYLPHFNCQIAPGGPLDRVMKDMSMTTGQAWDVRLPCFRFYGKETVPGVLLLQANRFISLIFLNPGFYGKACNLIFSKKTV